jgi:lysophospholipase L1-like esterase
MTAEQRRTRMIVERLALLIGSPLVFLLLAEFAIALSGVDTEVARNEDAQIAVPVWLLADDAWIADRRRKWRQEGEQPIAAAEVEWLYHFEEARWIGYKMKPNVETMAVNPFNPVEAARGIEFSLTSNADGFRERPFGPKRPGTFRIVTLGDSSTFGWGVEPEFTYQRLLEERLNRGNDNRFEVLNLGIPGHNTRHGLGVLRHHALELEPDVLIISYGANDPRRVPVPTALELAPDDTWQAGLRYTLMRLRTYRLLRRTILGLSNPLRPGVEETPTVSAVPREDYQSNLETFVDLGAQHGAGVIFLSVCTSEREYAATMRDVAAARGAEALDVRQTFSDHIDALEAGTEYAELVDRYRQLYGELFNERRAYAVTSDGCHPHAVGHSLIADELVPLVQRALRTAPGTGQQAHGESQ